MSGMGREREHMQVKAEGEEVKPYGELQDVVRADEIQYLWNSTGVIINYQITPPCRCAPCDLPHS